MGSKSAPPPGPDYDALLSLTEEYADKNYEMMVEYQDFQQAAYDDQKILNDQIAAIQLPAMEAEALAAQQARDRYQTMGIPFEDEYLNTITNWDTAAKRDERAGEAQAGVTLANDAARESAMRDLESYGVDPSQTRSAAMDSQLRLQGAVTSAAAGNQQRNMVEQEGIGLGGEAVNIYRGMPAQSAQSMAASTAAGQTAFGNQGALTQMGTTGYTNAQNMNTQGFNMTNQGYNTAGNMYQNDLAAYDLQQQNSVAAGFGNLLGTTMGAAGAVGGFGPLFAFAEGGPVPQGVGAGAIPNGTGDGGQAPAAAPRPQSQGIPSDSRGILVTPGEFVIPDDVARWEGEKNLQKIVNKAREGRVAAEQERAQNQRSLGIPA